MGIRFTILDGAFLIFNRSNFMTLSGFDELFKFYGEETEFCHRAHSGGYKVAFYRSCEIHHKRGGSSEHLLKNNGSRKVKLLTLAKLNIAKSRYKNIYFYRVDKVKVGLWYNYSLSLSFSRCKCFLMGPCLQSRFFSGHDG